MPSLPQPVASSHSGWTATLVRHEIQDVATWRMEAPRGGEVRFVKAAPAGWYPRIDAEAERTRWAGGWLAVADVLAEGVEDGSRWFVTGALPGWDATRWGERTPDPTPMVRAFARGLRAFHDAAPVAACPFDFRLDTALAWARRRLAEGRIDPGRDFHAEFDHLDAARAIEVLEATRPPSEDLVVCHGDYCLPNVLLEGGGDAFHSEDPVVTGFIDLGELGVADRWWDLAAATWSLEWNVGDGFEDVFLEAYGAEWDAERMAFYRLLYDVVS